MSESERDQGLAIRLLHLQATPLKDRDDVWVEALLLAENEVCARASISLDETEQGLTPNAVAAINAWVEVHK